MGGSESIRGYLVQALIGLLDAMEPDADWHTVMLEADKAVEKVDFVWFSHAGIKATQVKSSKNQISIHDCRTWALELRECVSADEYEMVLVGPCSRAVIQQKDVEGVTLRPPLNLDLQAMIEQATHRLDKYVASQHVPGISGVARELIIKGLLAEFLSFAAARSYLTRQQFDEKLNEWVILVGDQIPESKRFSDSIRQEFMRIHRTIEFLTKDQINLTKSLRKSRRARISGVAGSGKTLVAAEKSIRLAQAGFKTLLLCHSVHLAQYLEQLTGDAGIDVFDFSSWISQLTDKVNITTLEFPFPWTHFEEPRGDQLERALETLLRHGEKYDAIIVDEGQDFRPKWWTIVEAALKSDDTGILYIFHDDNQALLPARAAYPPSEAVYDLSKNCRNAGSIFSLVRKFHKQAPEVSAFLEGTGVTKLTFITHETADALLEEAVRDALKHLSTDNIIVVTTEEAPPSASTLNGRQLFPTSPWIWQHSIYLYLKRIRKIEQRERERAWAETLRTARENNQREKLLSKEDYCFPCVSLPTLSNAQLPTKKDVQAVVSFANAAHQSIQLYLAALPASAATRGRETSRKTRRISTKRRNLLWEHAEGKLYLRHLNYRDITEDDLIRFFSSPDWAENLPMPPPVEIRALDQGTFSRNGLIRLHTPSSVKGLEADAVIVFARASGHNIRTDFYVGISRAKVYLHILLSTEIGARIPQLAMRKN